MPRVRSTDFYEDQAPRSFDRSRRRLRGEREKHTGRSRSQMEKPHLHRLVENRKVVQAFVYIHVRDERLSSSDMAIVRYLLKTVAEKGLHAEAESLPLVLSGLRACAEWFVQTAQPHAVRKLYDLIDEETRRACRGCQLLAEILAPKAALAAA